jgi:hypothetical protein
MRGEPSRAIAMRLLAAAALVAPLVCAPAARDALEEGFRNPPPEARLRCYWWWLNGNTTQAAITRDLDQMKANGFGGALLVDAGGAEQRGNGRTPAGPQFGSPAWRKLFRHALAEAARLDLELSLNIQSGWNLGGPMVKPENSSKLLTWSRVTVAGPAAIAQPLARPSAREGFYRDIAVLAYPLRRGAGARRPIRDLAFKNASEEYGMSMPDTTPLLEDYPATPGEEDARIAQVQDLTARMAPDGRLAWRAPAGTWEIVRIGYTSSGACVSTSSDTWQGLAIDHLDHTALEGYWKQVVEPLLDDARPYLGRTLPYLVTDSWELGGANWTGAFREEFRRRRGYDPLPYLPVVAGRILDDRETSNRFLNDLRRTVADLIIAEHYQPFAGLAARAGLGIHPESGGPHGAPIDGLETLGVSAFPQTEFWARAASHRTRDDERFFVKQAASAAHIYGKTLVAAEGMTSIGPHWEERIWDNLKPSFDQAACEGLNRLIWHTFTSSPQEFGLPGQEFFAGTHLNPNVTWWKQAGAFLAYINRTQFLLQQGLPVADVVYYYGDRVPNFARLKSADPAGVLPGYDYDVVDERALVERMSVRDGRVVLPDGMSYRLLVLPVAGGVSPAALRAVRKLEAAGAVVLEPKGRRARDVLAELGVPPDFECRGGQLDYIHRVADGADTYFIRNTQAQPVHAEVTLRVRGKAPELWRPDAGRIEAQPVYDLTSDGRTRLPLWLEPYGSVFIVLRRPAGRRVVELQPSSAPVEVDLEKQQIVAETPGRYTVRLSSGETLTAQVPAIEPAAVEGPWTVRFTPGWGAPASVRFDKLASWTEHGNPGVRYYSGTATYSARFFVEGVDGPLAIDLGEVREIAEVCVNGIALGTLWKKPFRADVSAAVKPGWNGLEVEVTNLWPNRLIGDQRLPVKERFTRTNIHKFRANSPLLPSGLLGPVTLRRGYRAALRP